jgi:hypothetical protein
MKPDHTKTKHDWTKLKYSKVDSGGLKPTKLKTKLDRSKLK